MEHVNRKIARNGELIAGLYADNARLEKQKLESAGKSGIKKWRGNVFESSSGLTREFSDFARDFKRELKKAIGPAFELANWSRGHFYISGFVKNVTTRKLAYISTDDVRGGRDGWYDSILVRSAKHEKDYTGGGNRFTNWPCLRREIERTTAKDNWY